MTQPREIIDRLKERMKKVLWPSKSKRNVSQTNSPVTHSAVARPDRHVSSASITTSEDLAVVLSGPPSTPNAVAATTIESSITTSTTSNTLTPASAGDHASSVDLHRRSFLPSTTAFVSGFSVSPRQPGMQYAESNLPAIDQNRTSCGPALTTSIETGNELGDLDIAQTVPLLPVTIKDSVEQASIAANKIEKLPANCEAVVPDCTCTTAKTANPASKKTRKWEEALRELNNIHSKEFTELTQRFNEPVSPSARLKIDSQNLHIPKSIMSRPQSREVVHRMKRWLPSIAAVKGVVMPIANLDPNKIAPICCALIFGIMEACFNNFIVKQIGLTRTVDFEYPKSRIH
jgi:hypothetical protein